MAVLNMGDERKGQGEGTRGGNGLNGTHLMPPSRFPHACTGEVLDPHG
jgi:hypothetical protein